jgi:hypothetical protein
MAASNAPGMLKTNAATAIGSTAFSALPTAGGGGFSRRISAPKVSAKKVSSAAAVVAACSP